MKSSSTLKIITFILIIDGNATAQYFPVGLSNTLFNTWLDATDASTLPITSGKVGKSADKSSKAINTINTEVTKQPLVTTLYNKSFIEFRPTINASDATVGEGLIIAEKLNYMDPPTGSLLMQLVYVYPIIPLALNSRVSTYSRDGIGRGYRFFGGLTTKSTDRLLVANPSSSDAYPETKYCCFLNPKFKDMRDSVSIIENNSYISHEIYGQINVDGLLSYEVASISDYTVGAGIRNRPNFQTQTH